MQLLIQILVFIVTVLALVTVHEWGHFLAAKWLGVGIVKFSIGFGRPLVRWQGRENIEYAIAWLPLGGYVRLLDEREAPVPSTEVHRAFNRQSWWVRMVIVCAGPLVNLLFAVLAFWIVFSIGLEATRPVIGAVAPKSIAYSAQVPAGAEITAVDGKKTKDWREVVIALALRMGERGQMTLTARPFDQPSAPVKHYKLNLDRWEINHLKPELLGSLGVVPFRPSIMPIIATVKAGSPADQAGLKVGDKILAIGKKPVKDWFDLAHFIHRHPETSLTLKVKRGQQPVQTIKVTLKRLWVFPMHQAGYLGIAPKPAQWPESMTFQIREPFWWAWKPALHQVGTFLTFNAVILGKLLIGRLSLSSLGGPITIYQVANRAFLEGVIYFIHFLGIISVMLAFVNFLPIPGLDGGHVLYFLIEAVRGGKPLSTPVQLLVLRLGIIFLVVILVQATINDLIRLF